MNDNLPHRHKVNRRWNIVRSLWFRNGRLSNKSCTFAFHLLRWITVRKIKCKYIRQLGRNHSNLVYTDRQVHVENPPIRDRPIAMGIHEMAWSKGFWFWSKRFWFWFYLPYFYLKIKKSKSYITMWENTTGIWEHRGKHEPQANVFYISRVFSNVLNIFPQCIEYTAQASLFALWYRGDVAKKQ